MKEKLSYLGKKLIQNEQKLIYHIQEKQRELEKINNHLLKQEYILKEILPLKIKGLLLMDKLNLVKSLEYSNLNVSDENLDNLLSIANKAVSKEWESIIQIIENQSKILKELSKSASAKS